MKPHFLVLIVFLCLAGSIFLSRQIEAVRPNLDDTLAEEDLYFSPQTTKLLAGQFDGLAADYYWMKSLQYVGRKVLNYPGEIQLDDMRALNPRLLYPMLDTATTLDPKFTEVYSYGSMVLPAVDLEQAVKISEKGIAAQPDNWKLYHHLGYIYWKSENYAKAAEVYAAGAAQPKAPAWMRQMSAKMQAEGGSRNTAREIYRQIYDSAQDEQTRELAAKRLQQLDFFDERDAIRPILTEFQNKFNRCPNNWREVFPLLKNVKLATGQTLRLAADNSPVDPSGAAYLLVQTNGKCDADLDGKTSKIPKS